MNTILILHDIRSLHNVGSIFRTAAAAGIEKIFLTGITPAPVDRFGKIRSQLAKVSLGAEKTVPWNGSTRSPRATLKLLGNLKREGFTIFAVEQSKKSLPYYRLKMRGIKAHSKFRAALVFGNEVTGLPATILRASDTILEIPMRGSKESLNVSVAAGIVIFHLVSLLRHPRAR